MFDNDQLTLRTAENNVEPSHLKAVVVDHNNKTKYNRAALIAASVCSFKTPPASYKDVFLNSLIACT